jgi:membrane protein DedA with SNARE-associated domain/uncharacterized tellurite resistance protein B-like protein
VDRARRRGRHDRRRHGGARPLIDALVTWLAALPPAAIYFSVAVFAGLENAFPFVPSDVAILGVASLLVRDGPLDPGLLWGAATIGNTIGALIPWAIARRFGPRLAQGRLGKRLLPPDTVSLVEREYLRFGLPGIFLCRLIPGVRFIVAPFAGLVGIGPVRTIVPLGLAAMLWYGLIVGGGWLIGGQREALLRFLRGLNFGLAVAAGVIILALGIWWYQRRQRLGRAAGARLAHALEGALAEMRQTAAPEETDQVPLAATTMLLVELAAVDEEFDPAALAALETHARERWGLGSAGRPALGVDYREHAHRATAGTDPADRIALASHVWRMTLADGALSQYEKALIDRMAAFLSLSPDDLAQARRQAERGARPSLS